MKQFAVIGLGRFGFSVASTLSRLGAEVLAIDTDGDKVQRAANLVTHAVQADGTNEDSLKALGIRNFDVLIVAIGHDIQSSILATSIVKTLGVKYVVAKAQNDLHGKVLEKIGADRIVYPERDMGIRVANSLLSSNILDFIELSPEYNIVEISVGTDLMDKSLKELNLRSKLGINVVAIRTKNDIQISPGGDDILRLNDILVVIGKKDSLDKLQR